MDCYVAGGDGERDAGRKVSSGEHTWITSCSLKIEDELEGYSGWKA